MTADLVGYETLIDEIILRENLLAVPGDFVEIGALAGGGTVKLASFLQQSGSAKSLWVVEAFKVDADSTVNTWGEAMTDIYRHFVAPSDWKESFMRTISPFGNIMLFDVNSLEVQLPDKPVAFAFIDGNHQREYVESDFENCWKRLSPGGVLAMHDFGGNVPGTTETIKACIDRHREEIQWIRRIRDKTLISIKRKSRPSVRATAKIAVLFCHHQTDPLTLHHLELLRQANCHDPLVTVIPCGFPESQMVEDAVVLAPDPRLPKNEAPRLRGRWGEVDLIMYQFMLSGMGCGYDRLLFLENDCKVTAPVREIFANDLDLGCGGNFVKLGVKDCWGWQHWEELPAWKKLLFGNHAAAVTPTNGVFASTDLMRRVSDGLVRSSRLFDNMHGEIRLGTACRIFAEDISTLLWMENENEWFVSEHRNPNGKFLHPVKNM
ncbi:MAG: class I SAM-dependent methyltransferase [Luteolibacter sp.]|uniref:class I SAM-dependent methyltransferase n=1 Tax=Luteolibacter sp. TaxID=1962973 RepID=UPI0032679129